MKYSKELKQILQDLKDGYVYAEWLDNVTYPMWWVVLKYDRPYIAVRYFGGFTEKATLKDLKWTLDKIFKMTPQEFTEKYTKVNRYNYDNSIKEAN